LPFGHFEPYFKCTVNVSTDSIGQHEAPYYDHEQFLNYVDEMYIYAAVIKYSNPLEPEIGIRITTHEEGDAGNGALAGFILGVSYEKLRVDFYNGIEAWNKPHWYKIDHKDYDVINLKAGGFLTMTNENKWYKSTDLSLLFNQMICNGNLGFAIEFNLTTTWKF
jgi:hypothetical protein